MTVKPARAPTASGTLGRWRGPGPGAVVAAAFIGPGTVTTATLAGAGYGYALLWALSFSIIATLVLQEMSARLGLATGAGLGEAVRERFGGGLPRFAALALIISAIAIGNAAYEAGNLLGATLGMRGIIGGAAGLWVPVFAGTAFLLLWSGRYRVIERFLIAMVALMSAVFLATAVVLMPPVGEVLRGLLVPSVPADGRGLLLALALVGTTVVPYNLFLHAAAISERWSGAEELPAVRTDLLVAIITGGIVSMAIVVTAAAALQDGGTVASASDMAAQLEPLLGGWARVFFAAGLFAAGMTSAITAPLAAAYAVAGALGWKRDLRSPRLRAVWGAVLLTGVPFAILGTRPTIPLGFGEVSVIVFAQVANGILLPAMAMFLLVAVNDRRRMGGLANGPLLNTMGGLVVLATLVIGASAIYRALSAG
jgi:manganese transport protein